MSSAREQALCRHRRFEHARRALEAGFSRAARAMAREIQDDAEAASRHDPTDPIAASDLGRAARWLRWLEDDVRRAS